MIHIMAAIGLGGTAMSAPVVGYDAIAVLEEEQHLRVPIIGRQRPAVAKDDGLTFAPVLVVDLRPIFRRNCRHVMFSFALIPSPPTPCCQPQVALAPNSGALSEIRSSRTFTRGWPLDAAGLSFGWPI